MDIFKTPSPAKKSDSTKASSYLSHDDCVWEVTDKRSKELFQSPKYQSDVRRQHPVIFTTPDRHEGTKEKSTLWLFATEVALVVLVALVWTACFKIKASQETAPKLYLLSKTLFGAGFFLFVNACFRYCQHKREHSQGNDTESAMWERVAVFKLPLMYVLFFWITQEIFKHF